MTMINPRINNNIEIPVIFYDGETEIDLGKVEITPAMSLKLLQSTLSNKIGISPNHITIYLDHQQHHRRRHPVTSKFDFSTLNAADSQDNIFLWVVLKRSRRGRRPQNDRPFMLLRRGVNDLDYFNWLKMMESYYMSLNLNSHVYDELKSGHGFSCPNYQDNYSCNYNYGNNWDDVDAASSSCSSERVYYCDVCCNSSSPTGSSTVPFHWCKNDVVVTSGFRSLLGPIAPPKKNTD